MPECLSSQARVIVSLMPNKPASLQYALCVHLPCIFTCFPRAAAGSGELLWCWCVMRVATIDCARLSVVCHSACLWRAVWTNDSRAAMTTGAQSTLSISLYLSVCLSNWFTPLLVSHHPFSLPAFVCMLSFSLLHPPSPASALLVSHSLWFWRRSGYRHEEAGRQDGALMRWRKRKEGRPDQWLGLTFSHKNIYGMYFLCQRKEHKLV